ncbi:MAG: hypothetical protein NVSMB19_26590 [Vulcanimicrobiaceae bacterium]
MLTPERKAIIVGLISSGNYMATAADYVGISVDVVDEALRRGRSAHSGPDFDFRVDVAKAHALWTAGLVAATTHAASRNPEIALKMLSRRAKGWSERDVVAVQHSGAVGSFDAAPAMAQAVRMDSASNVAFHEFLARLSDAGAFEPGGSSDDREPRHVQATAALGSSELRAQGDRGRP